MQQELRPSGVVSVESPNNNICLELKRKLIDTENGVLQNGVRVE